METFHTHSKAGVGGGGGKEVSPDQTVVETLKPSIAIARLGRGEGGWGGGGIT